MKLTKQIVYFVLFNLFLVSPTFAQSGKGVYMNSDNIAINGHDVVNYFTQNNALRGSKGFSVIHEGVEYYFANAENQESFKANPAKYVPQYGGYCAFAMSAKNAKVPSNPGTFKLYNGKLYLFFNDYYEGTPFNTIIPWNADEASMKVKADGNWAKMN